MIVVSQIVTRRVTAPLDEVLMRSEKLALAGLMAARVAHDIRNPLSSIKMQTQLVGARLRGDAETQAQVGAVLRDIQQVETVVKDLIELARPGELKRRPTPLNDVIRDVLNQLAPQLTYRKIAVDAQLADGLPVVELDADRFRQMLINVLGNAADAMTTGGTLRVVTRQAAGGSTVVLDVCDDGIGIDPAIRDRVFDPFVSTKRDGVGLGLVNAKAVIESHGGTIELFAAEPKGTCARMTVPVNTRHG
jgi:two-component system sensor histidine kinase HydH